MNRRVLLSGLLTAGAAFVCGRWARVEAATAKIKPDPSCVLIVVDVQNCFISGSLAIKDGDAVVPVINRIACAFQNVALTQRLASLGSRVICVRLSGAQAARVSAGVLWQPSLVAGSLRAGNGGRSHRP